jgi:hypothetical protein
MTQRQQKMPVASQRAAVAAVERQRTCRPSCLPVALLIISDMQLSYM